VPGSGEITEDSERARGGAPEADAPAVAESVAAPDAAPKRSYRIRRALAVFAGYLLVSVFLWRHLVPHLTTHTLAGGLGDPGLYIWWFKWVPYALTHGLNPLHSNFLDAPGGVSAMWNTSMPALGLVFAPVTLVFGPIVTFNLVCILGPPLSAWTAWLWLRRHVRDAPAVLGGLIFGFSPFVMAQSHGGHVNFTWLAGVPVVMMLIEDLLWRSPRPIWPTAPLLGVTVAVQFLVSSEVLLITSLGCAGMVVALAIQERKTLRHRVQKLLPAAAVAVGVAVVLGAWPLYEQFRGDSAIRGPVQPIGAYGGRPGMLVAANRFLEFHSRSPGGHLTSVENGLYIGWPLLALLAVTAVLCFRRRGVLIAVAALVVAIDFQMYGTRWHLLGHSFPTPFNLLQTHVEVTSHILPGRFAVVMWLAIAWLVAVGVDEAITRVPGRRALAVVIVALACLVPLVPASAERTPRLAVTPALFRTDLRANIPDGATVMVAPMATAGNDAAELWQVRSGMRFRQLGGYMVHAVGTHRTPSYGPSAQALTTLFGIDLTSDRPYKGELTPALLDAARAELRASGASMLIVGYSRLGVTRLIAIPEQLLGRPADRRLGDTSIWDL
jgi:hypothetical protein